MASLEVKMLNPNAWRIVQNIREEGDNGRYIILDPSKAKKYFNVVTSMRFRDPNGDKYIDQSFKRCQKEDFEM